jgi:anaerobic magnesium-protoporphyrin IX monomethyl ester cyclase
MTKVLLIQPNTLTFGGVTAPPLGLLFIGTYLKSNGYDVKIIDRNVDFFSYRKIVAFAPDVVGITTLTGKMLIDAIQISKFVKQRWNGKVPVVWGGIHTSLLPEQTLRNDFVDYAVIGEGEISFHQLLQTIGRGESLEGVKGIGYKDEGSPVITPRREFIKNLDELPHLDWSLVNYKAYCRTEVTLVTSRGCPFNCSFCYNQVFNKRRWRGWSAERTLEEIKKITTLTSNLRLKFYDDNFGANRKRLDAILNGLDKRHDLWIELRIDSIDESLLENLSLFKSTWIFLGVESGDERILKKMSKNLTVDMIREKFELIKRYKNLETTGSIVIGCPGETKKEILTSVKFLEELSPTRQGICIFAPFPGTEFYQEAVTLGLFTPPETTEGWANFISDLFTCTNLACIDPEVKAEVKRLYRRGYAKTILNFILRGQFFKFWHKAADIRPLLVKLLDPVDQRGVAHNGKSR